VLIGLEDVGVDVGERGGHGGDDAACVGAGDEEVCAVVVVVVGQRLWFRRW
jgi:hypothetical protein